jgi:hypothetical protein
MLDQFTAADIDLFYSGVKLGARTKGKWLGTLRSFFRFAMNRKWLPENPISLDIKPPIGTNRLTNKAPFTNAELERIIGACDRVGTTEWKSGQGTGAWTGEEVKDFIWVMTYTGLRISDVAYPNQRQRSLCSVAKADIPILSASITAEAETRDLLRTQRWHPSDIVLPPTGLDADAAFAAVLRITGGNFRLLNRLLTQIARIMEINNLDGVTVPVVEAARESLVIGTA